jgi:hypothetical protein
VFGPKCVTLLRLFISPFIMACVSITEVAVLVRAAPGCCVCLPPGPFQKTPSAS